MTVEERAADMRTNMRHDMANTLRQHFGPGVIITAALLDALVDDGMFHVEHLLIEDAALQQQIAARDLDDYLRGEVS